MNECTAGCVVPFNPMKSAIHYRHRHDLGRQWRYIVRNFDVNHDSRNEYQGHCDDNFDTLRDSHTDCPRLQMSAGPNWKYDH
jgi:hypothetical protein